jgi:rhodanese-related sulfurtransferase
MRKCTMVIAVLAAVLECVAVAAGPRAALAAAPPPAHAAPAKPDTVPVARMGVPQAMLAATRGEILLVDVRPAGQRALGHIKGDLHVPLDRIATSAAALPAGKRLVFYCSCGAEELALDAARLLLQSRDLPVAALVGGYDAWRAAGGDIQVDATWEEIFHVEQPPVGWGKTPVDTLRCRYSLDGKTAAQGAASACITCRPDTSSRGFAGFTQRMDARAFRGRHVELSAMVRTEDVVPPGAFLWIGAEDSQGRILTMTRPDANPLAGTQDWKLCQVSGVVPPDAVKVLIGLSLVRSGRVWLDDVRFVAPEDRGAPRIRAVVANHSFEE